MIRKNIEYVDEILDMDWESIINVYKNVLVLDEGGKVMSEYYREKFQVQQYTGFEMEVMFDEEWCFDDYHSGSRGRFNGIQDGCFVAIERDGSLGENGGEFITAMHTIADKVFFLKLENELRFIDGYIDGYDDYCGGHIHHSFNGIEKDIYKWISPFRAYVPFLIEIFGNGEYGIRRVNDYFDMGILPMLNEERYGLYYKGDNHVEHRYFDSEVNAFRWYARELFLKWLGLMGINTKREGIFRYISPEAWVKGYLNVKENKFKYVDHKVIEVRDFIRELNKMIRIYGTDAYERYAFFKVLSSYVRDRYIGGSMYEVLDEDAIREEMGNDFMRKRIFDMEYMEVI